MSSLTYSYISDAFTPEKKKKKKNATLSPENHIFSSSNSDIKNRVDSLNMDPYTNDKYPAYVHFNQGIQNQGIQNQGIQNQRMPNNNSMKNEELEMFKIFKDEYKEFKEWRESRNAPQPRSITGQIEPFANNISNVDEEFNKLLLYIFTGIFILFIYDNIYKIGKMSV